MTKKRVNRILLLNDDGIDAPGIALLKEVAQNFANEVWVVAPAIDQSGVSCAVSLKVPFRVAKRGEHEYAVYGTPADCASFAIRYLMQDTPPDLVLSGVNSGSNLGFETVLSGTVGGAMMAMVMGMKAIAFSQVTEEGSGIVNWSSSKCYLHQVIDKLLASSWSNNICMNVNFPHCDAEKVKGIKLTIQGASDVDGLSITPVKDPQDNDFFWFRALHSKVTSHPERELDAVNLNYVTITPLSYERTDLDSYNQLKKEFEIV